MGSIEARTHTEADVEASANSFWVDGFKFNSSVDPPGQSDLASYTDDALATGGGGPSSGGTYGDYNRFDVGEVVSRDINTHYVFDETFEWTRVAVDQDNDGINEWVQDTGPIKTETLVVSGTDTREIHHWGIDLIGPYDQTVTQETDAATATNPVGLVNKAATLRGDNSLPGRIPEPGVGNEPPAVDEGGSDFSEFNRGGGSGSGGDDLVDDLGINWGKVDRGKILQWHHLLPIEVFEDLAIAGVDINSKEYGWILRWGDHTMVGDSLHSKGWNTDWATWLNRMTETSTEITKEAIDQQLKEMTSDPKYAGILARGFKAKLGHTAWREFLKKKTPEALRRLVAGVQRHAQRAILRYGDDVLRLGSAGFKKALWEAAKRGSAKAIVAGLSLGIGVGIDVLTSPQALANGEIPRVLIWVPYSEEELARSGQFNIVVESSKWVPNVAEWQGGHMEPEYNVVDSINGTLAEALTYAELLGHTGANVSIQLTENVTGPTTDGGPLFHTFIFDPSGGRWLQPWQLPDGFNQDDGYVLNF